ncbi:MAG: hypothetical protein KatS3mg028_1591 [Bacteroidia bacterium]|nr:MAG: hypothetical protein KatS3mg028_1591 [Bacteroidia bacterium]
MDDGVAPSLYANDIDDQAPGNYAYDKVGNLIQDKQAKMQIRWTDYGKVKEIDTLIQGNPSAILPKLIFKYDATGNRLEKEYTGHYKGHLPKRPAGKCHGGVQDSERFLIFDRASDVWRETIGRDKRKPLFDEETHTKRHRHTGDCYGK